MGSKKIGIVVTDLGEYINQQCCERSFKLRLNKQEVARMYPFYPAVRNPLNPVLATTGHRREEELRDDLGKEMRYLNPGVADEDGRIAWERFVEVLGRSKAGEDIFATEVEVEREIGAFRVTGRMDFVLLRWHDGRPRLRIVECKASRKDKTYHRIQLASYRIMVRELLEDGLAIGGRRFEAVPLESVVARIDEETNHVQNVLELPSLDLLEEMEDVRNLLSEGGPLDRVASHDLDGTRFCLEPKCDSCVHCPICLPDAAHKRRLELVGADPSMARALRDNGIATLDDLADLDPFSDLAHRVRGTAGLNDDIYDLVQRAKARRSTLPGRKDGDYGVMAKENGGVGQLPAHDNGQGQRLVRVYLDVGYDYTEDRVVSLAAHVTDSAGLLLTPRSNENDPVPLEIDPAAKGTAPLNGQSVVRFKERPWTGEPAKDGEAEGELVRSFFEALAGAIEKVSGSDDFRPLHFYVWSQREMADLIDACSRAGGPLLRNLTELLGCREECQGDLEQMIFTPLGDELDRKYVLGYTGRSLVTATAFKWFSFPMFHWTRLVGGKSVDLARPFRRDLFDFKTVLFLDEEDGWSERGGPRARRQNFEIRTRFSANLTSPYWHAMWGILPDPGTFNKDPLLKRAIEDYRGAGRPELVEAFLECKCQALRWLEERFDQDGTIVKPLVPIRELRHIEPHFAERYGLVRACQDFLRLDHHMKKVEWIAAGLSSPAKKVAEGTALPIRDGAIRTGENRSYLEAALDLQVHSIEPKVFFSGCTIGEGSFVRVTPCSGNINEGQRIGDLTYSGATGIVEALDASGRVEVTIIPSRRSDDLSRGYIMRSSPVPRSLPYGLVGESISNYVSHRVDSWLEDNGSSGTAGWFDPGGPGVPARPALPPRDVQRYAALLRDLKLAGHGLDEIQLEACMDGLANRVQLLLGPPGTGKTNTTAAAVLLRLAARKGNRVFVVSANTHTAVDELMGRLRRAIAPFGEAAGKNAVPVRPIIPLRLGRERGEAGYHISPENSSGIMELAAQGDVVIGGSIGDVLKMAGKMNETRPQSGPFRADGLIVDEASMMIFPAFLALATIVAPDGEIMLAGDHLQLSPITAHRWEKETREQVLRYAPHESAYVAVQKLCARSSPGAVKQSSLSVTYRLTPELTHLISGIYRREGYGLESRKEDAPKVRKPRSFRDLWSYGGVFLVVHGEDGSRKSNEFEALLLRDILAARPGPPDRIPPASVSVITPHRAQRTVLRTALDGFGDQIKMIDTVERLQGGECETIIVSGTQSDASAIAGSAEFILDLNRTNVIFSRAKERLIVVCSRNLLDSVPADLDDYNSSWLWKRLRSLCDTPAAAVEGYGHDVRIMVPGQYWTE